MRKLYIKGLVRVADTVRRSLAAPLSPEQKADLRKLVANTLAQVNDILATSGAAAKQLPVPSRRAYEFLKNADLENTASGPPNADPVPPLGTVSLIGLRALLDGVIERLARPLDNDRADELRESITITRADIHRHLVDQNLQTENLKRASREAFAWLTFFSIPENFDAYVATVRVAHPILREAMSGQPKCHPNLLLEFRPMSGLFRVRGFSNATRVVLPTPMISFDEALFRALGSAIFRNGSKQAIIEAAQGEIYQTIQAEFDALAGMEEHAAGMQHDLRESFERVARQYFTEDLSRPRLIWNRTLTGRKFGHFDPITDTVMLSCTLDHADVPCFVVDFVMYHELLHKTLGVDWRNGRQAAHTPGFRRREKLFEQYAAAESALKELARKHG